jgi:hypothetical protein
MPWKECQPMDERLRFVARLLEGEKMAPLCAEFGDLAQDGLQNLRPVQSMRRLLRPQSAAVSASQPPPCPDRGDDCPTEAGVCGLGRPEDSGEAPAPGDSDPASSRD